MSEVGSMGIWWFGGFMFYLNWKLFVFMFSVVRFFNFLDKVDVCNFVF